MDIEELKKRLRNYTDSDGGSGPMILEEAVDAIEQLQRQLSEQAEREAFNAAVIAELVAQVAALQDENAVKKEPK